MRLAIVGGGLAGLSAAYEAEQRSDIQGLELETVIYEAADCLGGKLRTIREEGFIVEQGADAMIRYKPWALELCRDVGLEPELIETLPADPTAFIFTRGHLAPIPHGLNVVIPGDVKALLYSSLFTARGKARALGDLILPRRSEPDEALGDIVTRRFGRELWQNLASPLLAGIYGGDPATLSTRATFPQFLELEERDRSLILGSRRTLRERSSNREQGTLFASLTGGLGSLVETLVDSFRMTDIRLGTPISSLEELDADAVVLAAPAFVSAAILRDRAPRAASVLGEIEYIDSTSVTLAFDLTSIKPFQGHGILFGRGVGLGVRGLSFLDRKWAGRAPDGWALVRAFLAEDAGDLDDEDIVQRVLRALECVGSYPGVPFRTWVARWPRGVPRYAMGHPDRVRLVEDELHDVPEVFIAGSGYHGLGIPDVIRDGREAGRRAVLGQSSLLQARSPSRG